MQFLWEISGYLGWRQDTRVKLDRWYFGKATITHVDSRMTLFAPLLVAFCSGRMDRIATGVYQSTTEWLLYSCLVKYGTRSWFSVLQVFIGGTHDLY